MTPSDCWGGTSQYKNPWCPECEYNVTGYLWHMHVKKVHDGVDPRPDPYLKHPKDD